MPSEKEVNEAITEFLQGNKEPESPKPNLNVHTPPKREKSWAEQVRPLADRRRMPIERQVG